MTAHVLTVDCLGRPCPVPVIETAKAVGTVEVGQVLRVLADDPAAAGDLAAWCRMRGHTLVSAAPPSYDVRRDH